MSDERKKTSNSPSSSASNKAADRPGGPGLGHGPLGMAKMEKAKDFKGTMRKLAHSLKAYTLHLLAVLFCAVISTLFTIVGPTILGDVTSEIFNGLVAKLSGTGSIAFPSIHRLLLILLTLYIASSVFYALQGWIMSGIANQLTYRLRNDVSAKINRMPLKYFESHSHGEVLSRITNDIDTLGQSLNQSLAQLVANLVTLVGVVIMMLRISLPMTLTVLLILPLSALLIGLIMKFSQEYFRAQQKHLGEINGQVEEVFSGLHIVKAFNREKAFIREFEETNEKLYGTAWKSQVISGLMMPLMMFVSNLGFVAVAILGGYLAIKNLIQVGDIQAFIQYVRSFSHPIQAVAQIGNLLQSTAAAAERIFEFLAEQEEESLGKQTVSLNALQGHVAFEHVSFGYDPQQMVIHDFTAQVPSGKKVAIVGPTGAGKTTIVKLLMRFYDVNSGSIRIDGHDLRDFDRNELRRFFGIVLQDSWLFNGTILENIRYGRLEASDDEVIAAAKAAHAHHFIMTLPEGYNMVLNEESSNISQGQKQLLTIARAILANHTILILDEATSSVDTRTEILIQKAMDHLMQGRTSFIIAHRLSTIRNADRILCIKDGDIVEQGTHEELLAEKGFYAELYNSQFEGAS